MNNVVFLLTKDAMPTESLPVYGNKYWKGKTPNIDALAEKGTVYRKYYTAGGSTTMAMTAMLSGHNLYEFASRKVYTDVEKGEFPSLYDYFQDNGYECHLIWDKAWTKGAWSKIGEFGDESKVILHDFDIRAITGAAKPSEDYVNVSDDNVLEDTLNQIYNILKSIPLDRKLFVWMHLPHVLKGRRCYMEDMDAFDHIVGFVREIFGDENIYISADHGHMNMHRGLVGYGYDVYEPVIRIPLITPRTVEGLNEVNYLTCNTDLIKLFNEDAPLPKRDMVVAETQYMWQDDRKVAVLDGRFKYIYNHKTNTEELYDLEFEQGNEEYNILVKSYYDTHRKRTLYYDEYYFYPYAEEAMEAYKKLKAYKDALWVEQSKKSKFYQATIKRFPFVKKIRGKMKF